MIGLLDIAEQLSRALATVPAAFDDEDERRGRRLRGGGGCVRSRGDGPRSSGAAAGSVRAFSVRGRVASESASSGRQAAVIKIASFAAGARRVGALTDYLSRDGELAVETESGFRLTGSEAIRAETADWADLFANRAPSKDVATLKVAGLQGEVDEATAAFEPRLDPAASLGSAIRKAAAQSRSWPFWRPRTDGGSMCRRLVAGRSRRRCRPSSRRRAVPFMSS